MWVASYYYYSSFASTYNDCQFNALSNGAGDEWYSNYPGGEGLYYKNNVTFHQIIPTPITQCPYKRISDITDSEEDMELSELGMTHNWHDNAYKHNWIKDCWWHINDLYDTSISDDYMNAVYPYRPTQSFSISSVLPGWQQPGVWVAGDEEPVFVGYYNVYSHKQNNKYVRTGLPWVGAYNDYMIKNYTYGMFRKNPPSNPNYFTSDVSVIDLYYNASLGWIEWFDGTTGNWTSDYFLPPEPSSEPWGPQKNGAVIYDLYEHLNMVTDPSILL